jgi:hypothetical protein
MTLSCSSTSHTAIERSNLLESTRAHSGVVVLISASPNEVHEEGSQPTASYTALVG